MENLDKKKVLDKVIMEIEKVYGKGVIMKFGEMVKENIDVIFIGVFFLDIVFGVGGVL